MAQQSETSIVDIDAPYWEGAARGVLVLQQCEDCGQIRHYPRLMCSNCHSLRVGHVEATGRGRVVSWTISHHAFSPKFAEEVPYALVTVELDEGVRILGRAETDFELEVDRQVRVEFRQHEQEKPTLWCIAEDQKGEEN